MMSRKFMYYERRLFDFNRFVLAERKGNIIFVQPSVV